MRKLKTPRKQRDGFETYSFSFSSERLIPLATCEHCQVGRPPVNQGKGGRPGFLFCPGRRTCLFPSGVTITRVPSGVVITCVPSGRFLITVPPAVIRLPPRPLCGRLGGLTSGPFGSRRWAGPPSRGCPSPTRFDALVSGPVGV